MKIKLKNNKMIMALLGVLFLSLSIPRGRGGQQF